MEQILFNGIEIFVPALHHKVCCSEGFLRLVNLVRLSCLPEREGGHVLRVEAAPEKAAERADHGAGIEHGVDATLGVVAHDEAAELLSCRFHASGGVIPQTHFRVVVLEVGAVGVGAEVAPFADDRVADKAVMGFVGVTEHHHIAQFAAALAVGAEGGGAINLGVHLGDGVVAQGDGAAELASLHHLGMAADIDDALTGVEEGGFHDGSLFNEDAAGIPDDGVGRAERLRLPSGGQEGKITLHFLSVPQENMVGAFYELVIPVIGALAEGQSDGAHLEIVVKEVAQITAVVRAEGEKVVLIAQGLAARQGSNSADQLGRWDEVAGNQQIVIAFSKWEFFLQIGFCEAGGAGAEQLLPFFTEGENADTKVCRGPGEGERHQMRAAPVVEKDNVHRMRQIKKKRLVLMKKPLQRYNKK